jgi:hypothetical protein
VSDLILLPRKLDLSKAEDSELLRQAAAGVPALADLVKEELPDFLRLFPEQHWRAIFPGGMLTVRTKGRSSVGLSIVEMLRTTRALKKMAGYKGFEKLIAGFRNPTQVLATAFEVAVAQWCTERAVHICLEFSPEVSVKGRIKRPEFLWKTTLGNLYVECKRGEIFDNDFQTRLRRLSEICGDEYKRHEPWDAALRLDVVIEGVARNNVERRLRQVVERAASALHAGRSEVRFEDGEIEAVLRARQEPPRDLPGGARLGCVLVGTEPTRIDAANSLYTLTMSLRAYRVRAAGRLLREARSQLPRHQPSAVFIESGDAEACRTKIVSLLGQPEYANTPWVAVWGSGQLFSVWHQNQPFDHRLTEPREKK